MTFFKGRQDPVRKSGCMQNRPEPISGPCKMMADRAGIQSRIDAAEQDFQIRDDQVGNSLAFRSGNLFSGGFVRLTHRQKSRK
jgi:hypothetical protein